MIRPWLACRYVMYVMYVCALRSAVSEPCDAFVDAVGVRSELDLLQKLIKRTGRLACLGATARSHVLCVTFW